jgi:hypothetical protein
MRVNQTFLVRLGEKAAQRHIENEKKTAKKKVSTTILTVAATGKKSSKNLLLIPIPGIEPGALRSLNIICSESGVC